MHIQLRITGPIQHRERENTHTHGFTVKRQYILIVP